MPFVSHPNYKIPYALDYDSAIEELINQGKDEDEASDLLSSSTGYFNPSGDRGNIDFIQNFGGVFSSRGWIITITVNDVTLNFLNIKYSNSVSESYFDYDNNGNQVCVLKLDTSQNGFGSISVDAKVEISIIYVGDSYTPWIYYGNTRPELATRFNREPTVMGGLYPSLSPIEAISIKHFLDGNVMPLIGTIPLIIPLFSGFLIGTPFGSSTSTFKDVYMMFEFLDGRKNSDNTEKIMVRSAFNFKAIQISLTGDLFGASFATASTDVYGANYINMHSKRLPYINKSYKEDDGLVENASYFIVYEKKNKLYNFYLTLFKFYHNFTKNFISDEVTFDYYSFDNNTDLKETDGFFFLESNDYNYTPSLENIFSAISDVIDEKVIEKIQNDIDNDRDPNSRKYFLNIISDFNFQIEEQDDIVITDTIDSSRVSKSEFQMRRNVVVNDVSYDFTVNISGGMAVPKDMYSARVDNPFEDNDTIYLRDLNYQNAQSIFGQNLVQKMFSIEGFGCFVFSYLSLLLKNYGKSISSINDVLVSDKMENEDGTIEEFFNVNTIGRQCEQSLINFEFQDNDNFETLIDRIQYLYKNRENIVNNGIVFTDLNTEMRYWRKTVPIGQLYDVKGEPFNIVNIADNGDTVLNLKVDFKENNNLKIYIENGANSNLYNKKSKSIRVRGRLFYPKYFVGLKLDDFMDFTTAEGIASWYRVGLKTAKYLMENKDEIILVVRTNIYMTPTFEGDISLPFLLKDNSQSYNYKSQMVLDKIEDFAIEYEDKEEQKIELLPDEEELILDLGDTDIPLQKLSFSINKKEDSSEEINYGKYLYEIYYSNSDNNNKRLIEKFYAQKAFIEENNIVTFDLSSIKKISCVEVKDIEEDKKGKVFQMVYSYHTQDENYYFQDFDSDIWKIIDIKVGQESQTFFLINEAENVDIYDCVYNNETGEIIFNETINTDLYGVSVELANISNLDNTENFDINNYNTLKKGNKIFLRRVDSIDNSVENTLDISDISIGLGSKDSVERVDCVYGDNNVKHTICPTMGFVYLSTDSWSFTSDESAKYAGGAGSTRLIGDVISPFFYFDYFSDDDNYKIAKTTDTDLITIDRIYSNISSNAQPFVSVSVIGYEPPPEEVKKVYKLDTEYSEIMTKMSIIHSDGLNLNQKFSYIDFKSVNDDAFTNENSETYLRRHIRHSLPIFTGITTYTEKPLASDGEAELSFNLDQVSGYLTNLYVETSGGRFQDNFSEPIEIYDGSVPFGYIDGNNEISVPHHLQVSPSETEINNIAYSRVPSTRNIDSLTLKVPEGSNAGDIKNIYGEYIDSYLNAHTPQIFENLSGEYVLTFLNEDNTKIQLLISENDGHDWRRPSKKKLANDTNNKPITIYENVNQISNLVHVKWNDDEEDSLLFFFEGEFDSIRMLSLPHQIYRKIIKGYDEQDEDETESDIDEDSTYTDIIGDDNADCYYELFGDGNRIYTALNGATENYSVDRCSDGTLYMASITSKKNNLRIYKNIRPQEDDEEDYWLDIGVNLLDENSNLYKYIEDKDLYSVFIKWSGEEEDLLYVFLCVGNTLITYRVPPSILKYDFEESNEGVKERFQELINKERPILIIGPPDQYNFIEQDKYIQEEFEEQMISAEWAADGSCLIFYQKNGKIQSAKSFNMRYWEFYENV